MVWTRLGSMRPLTEAELSTLDRTPDGLLCERFPDHARNWLREIKRARRDGPETPEGYHVKDRSILKDGEGNVKLEWVKTSKDREDVLKALRSTAEALGRKVSIARVAAPAKTRAELVAAYPMGDPHFGMYAAARESGEDFNLKIAERNLVAAVDHLVDIAPPAETALIVNLGDFVHSDNFQNRTARSGNALDVSNRWNEVFEIGIEAMRRCIDRALEKHKKVIVVVKMGNHDDHTSIAIAVCLKLAYRNNPRVAVNTDPLAYHYFRFGKVLVGVAHGHNCKADHLGSLMAADRAKDWGETEFRYWLVGHLHHDWALKESYGCKVEGFRTLAPRDAYTTAAGYRAGRDMKCIVYDREHGEVLRHTVGVGML